ncbi:MAG: porin family protein [Siphonobacter sp.]
MRRFIWFLFLLPSLGSLAQGKMMFKGGLNVSSTSQAISDEMDNPLSKVGFHAGLGADIPLGSQKVTLQPALLFAQRGYIANYKTQTIRSTTTINYIDLPINLMGKLGGEERNTKFLIFAGGYVACGVGGKTKDRTNGVLQDQYNVRFNYDLKRFDVGVQGGVGVEVDYFQITAFYQQGLMNVSPYISGVHNKMFGLSLSYLFDAVF